MKKIITFFTVIGLSFSSLFAESFFNSNRYFELKANFPFSMSNNTVALGDMLVENLVIDFTKIADLTPNEGFSIDLDTNPEFSLGFDFRKFTLSFDVGVNTKLGLNIDKSLFDFLGYGYNYTDYTVDDPFTVGFDITNELFAYTNVNVGFSVGNFTIEARPSVFAPVAHVVPENAKVTITNTEDGTIAASAHADLVAYSISDIETNSFNINEIYARAGNSLGFDLGASVGYALLDNLDLSLDARIPIIPGHLRRKTGIGFDANVKVNLPEMTKGDSGNQFESSMKITDLSGNELTDTNTKLTWEDCDYTINRPLKLNLYATYGIVPDYITLVGGAGLGIINPFSSVTSEIKVYPEYYLAAKASLGGIIKAYISTEYTDRIFKHEVGFGLNIRLIEINSGVSLQSSNFASSFKITGLGSYVTFSVGI